MPQKYMNQVIELAIAIQQIPAPTFAEQQRAAYVLQHFQEAGLQDTSMDRLGNVFGRLTGRAESPSVVITAHLDSVFPLDQDLQVTRHNDTIHAPGIGDNALGVASLLGLVWMLQDTNQQHPGDVWLVANVAEEGLGNLTGMRAVVERFNHQPLAYLVVEGMTLGLIFHRGLAVRRFRIEVETAGGHSWADYGSPSAIHELARLVSGIDGWKLPEHPRTSLNVGKIEGGTSVNTIAARACCELDLRSEECATLDQITIQLQAMLTAAERPGIHVSSTLIGDRPSGAIPADHPLVKLAISTLNKTGIEPCLEIGSTDANLPLSLGLPAICIGITHGSGAHSAGEMIHLPPIAQGLLQLHTLVCEAFTLPVGSQ